MKSAFLLLLAIFPANARCDFFCSPGEEILAKAEMCEDNYLFVQAADQCVVRLNQEVAAATESLQKRFVQNDGTNQSLNFNNSLKDYGLSSETLARLIELNRQAIEDVRGYYPSLVEPEDMREFEGGIAWAETVDCWSRSRRSILHVVSVLEAKLRKLENTKAIADAHDNTSSQRQTKTGAITSAATIVKSTLANGAGKRIPGQKGISRNPASDITGVEDAKKKEAQGLVLRGLP